MNEQIKRMDIREFQEAGFLQEANRLFFHPLGLALEVTISDDGRYSLGGIWDQRDVREGIIFDRPPCGKKAREVWIERENHRLARIKLIGAATQATK